MAYQRRGERRSDRPPRFDRPERRDRGGGADRDRGERFEGRDRFEVRDRQGRGGGRFAGAPGGRTDEAAMSLRLDPRRVQLLKQIAGESGMRPGELVLRWVQERIDAERAGAGRALPAGEPGAMGQLPSPVGDQLAELAARIDALTSRVDELASGAAGVRADAGQPATEDAQLSAAAPEHEPAASDAAEGAEPSTAAAPSPEPEAVRPDAEAAAVPPPETEEPTEARAPRRRGRPPKAAAAAAGTETTPRRRRAAPATEANGHGRVPLHEEITAVLSERGPMSAADLARAITERGRYVAQRSTKPLDANAVNSRVSHPHYRARFTRLDGKIALADTAP